MKKNSWPAERVTLTPLEKIKPYKNNPRIHTREQIDMLARMMTQYGVDQPIVVDEKGIILKGHGRRLAAIKAGFKKFPVVAHKGLSAEQKRAMRIEDNQAGALAGWDEELLRGEIVALKEAGFDLELLGLDSKTLAKFDLSDEVQTDPDDVPEPAKTIIVRRGDVWQLGEHRIMCGDATSQKDWSALIAPPDYAAMVFTDPPYGVSYEAQSQEFDVIEGDDKRRDDLYKMLLAAMRLMATNTSDKGAFYIWHASTTRNDFADAMNASGIIEREYLIWVKPSIVLGHADYHWQHEPCFYASKTDQRAEFHGDRSDSTVWRVQLGSRQDIATTVGNGLVLLDGTGAQLFVQTHAPKNKKLRQIRVTNNRAFISGSNREDSTIWEVARDKPGLHPTQKPVELARRAIMNSSRQGEIVLDPFIGSGSTLIGCQLTARKCAGMDIDPSWVQVAIERWQQFTSDTARLKGVPFKVVATERAAVKKKTGAATKAAPVGDFTQAE